MAVVALVQSVGDVQGLLPWASRFALGRGDDVVVLNPIRGVGELRLKTVDLAGEDLDPIGLAVRDLWREIDHPVAPDDESQGSPSAPRPHLKFLRASHEKPHRGALAALNDAKADLLVLPKRMGKNLSGDQELVRRVYRRASCDTIFLRVATSGATFTEGRCQRILVPTAGGPHAEVALQLGADVAVATGSTVDALYVQADTGSEDAAIGERIIGKIVAGALDKTQQGSARPRVAVSNRPVNAIDEAIESGEYDLVILGASNQGIVQRMLTTNLPDTLLQRPGGFAVGTLRRAVPLATRVQRAANRVFRSVVPQLEREDRLALMERVQSSSQWDFDFIALVCLSTLIAGIGLLQSSPAVVIGAMLVAPLMTPLLGSGLSLVQGNLILGRNAARSVLFGFLVALGIAFVLGVVVPADRPTAEMLARGSPNLLDLAVAFFSGVAAAYAMSRPNLSTALPGVAIAAALVPPIATCGLALAQGEPLLSAGAAFLFLTNIVAIVLGAALSLFAVGVNRQGVKPKWVQLAFVTLLTVASLFAVPLSYMLYAQIRTNFVPEETIAALDSRIARVVDAQRVSITRRSKSDRVILDVVVRAPTPTSRELATDLARIARGHYGVPVEVQVTTELATRSLSP